MSAPRRTLISIVLIASLFAACTPAATTPPSPAPGFGSIEGEVIDAVTQAAIARATVFVSGPSGTLTLSTDQNGHYGVEHLLVGAYLVSAKIDGYLTDVIQFGIVADQTTTANIDLTPLGSGSNATEPPPASTSTPETPAATAIPVTSVPRPTQRSGGSQTYGAPLLLEPIDTAGFLGGEAQIVFKWSSVGALGPNDYYVIEINHARGVEHGWTKSTTYTAPQYLISLAPSSHNFNWKVTVKRNPHPGTLPAPTEDGQALGPSSATRTFSWRNFGSGPSSPLPTPVSPLPTP